MRTRIRIGFIGLLSLAAWGCSTNGPSPQQLEIAQQAPPTRIGLLTINEPKLYEVGVQYNLPNLGITLPGRIVGMGMTALAKGVDTTAHNYKFTEAIHSSGFKISDQLTADVRRELEKVGYQVVDAPITDHRHTGAADGGSFLGKYPQTQPPVDFYLHVHVGLAGYAAPAHGQPLAPILQVHTQLVSLTGRAHKTPMSGKVHAAKKTGEPDLLYAATMTYGGLTPVSSTNDIPTDPRYALSGMAHIEHPEHAAAGLKAASAAIADKLAQNLK